MKNSEKIIKLFNSFIARIEIDKKIGIFSIENYIDEISKYAILSNFVPKNAGYEMMKEINKIFEMEE